jgi:hypothetical protein
MTAPHEYRLQATIPVAWLDERLDDVVALASIQAGTLLDCSPMIVTDSFTGGVPAMVVRVDGRDGLVRSSRLCEAFPELCRYLCGRLCIETEN